MLTQQHPDDSDVDGGLEDVLVVGLERFEAGHGVGLEQFGDQRLDVGMEPADQIVTGVHQSERLVAQSSGRAVDAACTQPAFRGEHGDLGEGRGHVITDRRAHPTADELVGDDDLGQTVPDVDRAVPTRL